MAGSRDSITPGAVDHLVNKEVAFLGILDIAQRSADKWTPHAELVAMLRRDTVLQLRF
jgi:hypothetical protein